MSEARLMELRSKLMSDGWEIVDESGNPCSFKSLFKIEGDGVGWDIFHPAKNIRTVISFWINDHRGNNSRDLRDIQHGYVWELDLTLLFSKITSDAWRSDLQAFVAALGQIRPSKREADHD